MLQIPPYFRGEYHRIMGLGQFPNVVHASHHRVLKDLHRADLQHVQNDLSILRINFVRGVVQRLPS
jgi:hypothetical protein